MAVERRGCRPVTAGGGRMSACHCRRRRGCRPVTAGGGEDVGLSLQAEARMSACHCRRRRGCRPVTAGGGEDVGLSLQAEARREQHQIVARLHGEMRNRTSHTMEVNDKFGFLTKMEHLMDSTKVDDIDSTKDNDMDSTKDNDMDSTKDDDMDSTKNDDMDSTKYDDMDSVIDRLTSTSPQECDVTLGATKLIQERRRAARMCSISFSGWCSGDTRHRSRTCSCLSGHSSPCVDFGERSTSKLKHIKTFILLSMGQ